MWCICHGSDLWQCGRQPDSSIGRALTLLAMCPGFEPGLTAHFSHPVTYNNHYIFAGSTIYTAVTVDSDTNPTPKVEYSITGKSWKLNINPTN